MLTAVAFTWLVVSLIFRKTTYMVQDHLLLQGTLNIRQLSWETNRRLLWAWAQGQKREVWMKKQALILAATAVLLVPVLSEADTLQLSKVARLKVQAHRRSNSRDRLPVCNSRDGSTLILVTTLSMKWPCSSSRVQGALGASASGTLILSSYTKHWFLTLGFKYRPIGWKIYPTRNK